MAAEPSARREVKPAAFKNPYIDLFTLLVMEISLPGLAGIADSRLAYGSFTFGPDL
jgi:hypothetical protein